MGLFSQSFASFMAEGAEGIMTDLDDMRELLQRADDAHKDIEDDDAADLVLSLYMGPRKTTAAVERLTAERDAARSLAANLEQEVAVKDEALAELRELHAKEPGCYWCADCENDWPCPTARILDALAARLSAHLFPTDEEGASDE